MDNLLDHHKRIDFPADKNKFLEFSTRPDPPKSTKILTDPDLRIVANVDISVLNFSNKFSAQRAKYNVRRTSAELWAVCGHDQDRGYGYGLSPFLENSDVFYRNATF